MKRILSFIFLLCLACNYCCYATVVYVSSSQGNDTNDGFTERHPLKSIEVALVKGDTILLKSGDVFYENIDIKKGVLSKYGKGELPIICGFKRIINPNWINVGEHIWKISLKDLNYTGFNTQGSSMLNNIGCIHEYDQNIIHGRKVQYKNELKKDWDFWQTEKHDPLFLKTEDFDSLYLYYSGDPNKLQLEFSVGTFGARVRNAEVSFIRLEGFGTAGFAAKTHCKITNCEVDMIGGSTWLFKDEFNSLGNGIEFWISKDLENCLIDNNRISRCFDCGCTIQGRESFKGNISFRNNVIYDCCQGWEDFLTNESDSAVFKNCVFENNVIFNVGKTAGFDYPVSRFKYCHVLGNNFKGNKGMIIRNNTFVGGNYYCSGAYNNEYKSNVWQGNTCVIKRGDYILGNYGGTKDVIRIPTDKGDFSSLKVATDDAIIRYRKLTGDETTRFVIKDEKDIRKQIQKLKRKYLSK